METINLLPPGLWPVMLTPLKETNELDLRGLQELTDFYLEAGANGLFTNCLSSEMYQLTAEERLTITRTVAKQSNGRVPVVSTGTFSEYMPANIDFIKRIYDTGASAVVLITGILARNDEEEDVLKSRIEEIISRTEGIPLGLYECPMPYKRLVSAELMKWLADTGRFVYHKDTSCHIGSLQKKIQATQGSSFGLYNADTPTALDSLEAGARGVSPISANFYPELFTYLLKRFQHSGRTPELNQLYSMLLVMDKLVHTFYPYSAKLFLQKRGLRIAANSRIPTESMTQADKLRFDALFDMFHTLASRHTINLVLNPKSSIHNL
ncbi:dihydrodipicolinate synthase family protein [Rhodocytophaga aerolata]|uniref:Dihydrodipicolinate synthase family protein n=1 Tax=Rhodocytophaga aerolata TaxID=455078 RepID=A0ABT8RA77_9BACT|nr:dihydrodipicolinate synthase family protein [Rhodocytophaga aerolata]MDO1448965.1 dihydrodipicolinate synthase family protein [Rhodocytophaga aerolata]